MRHLLSLFFLSFLAGCHNDEINSSNSSCTCPDPQLIRTTGIINQEPATIVALTSSSNQVFYQIAWAGSPVKMSPCNLPATFQKDSLEVTLSGYFVRYAGQSLVDIGNLPFEITEIKLRD